MKGDEVGKVGVECRPQISTNAGLWTLITALLA